jgi:uncharacterized membrane protein
VTFERALPLVVFLGAFGAGCLMLELADVVTFTSYWAFLLLAAAPWLWWLHMAGRGGLRGARGVIALLVRLSLLGVLVFGLAEPRAVRKSDVMSLMYAVDMSDSIGREASDAGLEYVTRTVGGKKDNDEAGLVVFGRNAAVELPPAPSFPMEFVAVSSVVSPDGTNLEKALSLSSAVLPDENLNRIVLITDGTATEGSVSAALDELKARDVTVDVLPIQYGYEREVWLEKLELPQRVRVGQTYEAAVVLSSLEDGAGLLRLTENGETVYEEEVEFNAGKNRYVLPIHLREPGYYEYVARIDPPEASDAWEDNNRVINHLYLKGEGKVMVVTDPSGDERDWQTLVRALREARFGVEVRSAYEVPRNPLALMPYDCVALVNVPADALDVVQMQALHDGVYNQGLGLLMVGGANSFGAGGYHRTPVEKALPVSMDISQRKVMPKGALAIILHTCEFAQGNTWGKRIAKAAIRVLSDRDEVGVLAYEYSGGEQWIVPMAPAGEYDRMVRLINEATIGDMPSFAPTMQMGLKGLQASDAAVRHMIIISDGDPSPPTPALLQQFVDARVSISTVAINPHTPQDTKIMQHIASVTGGRYYYPSDPRRLPSIFIKEAKTLSRKLIQNVTFAPEAGMPSPILKGIGGFPELKGYVLTTLKDRAGSILRVPSAEGEEDPLLATWRYGLGKAGAFTSDLSPNWGAVWVNWEEYVPFVKQLITDLSRAEGAQHLQMQCFADGDSGVIMVEDYHPEGAFLSLEAHVSGPRGESRTVRLRQVGPRRYQGDFPLWGQGRYQVVASALGADRQEKIVGGFVVPYSREYLRFRSNPGVLREIAEETCGRMLAGDEGGEEVFVRERAPRSSSRPIFDWFLIALACLVPLDVGVRRIQLDWALIAGWFRRGKGEEAAATLGALLKRKREIPTMKAKGKRPRPRVGRTEVGPEEAPAEEPPRPEAEPEDGLSTTERLLRARKKWREDEEEDE